MDLMAESDRYQLYAEPNSGEVAYLDKATGQALFTNPYNINDISASTTADTKALLMSQVVLTYMDNGQEYTMNSYTEAADRNQIDGEKYQERYSCGVYHGARGFQETAAPLY